MGKSSRFAARIAAFGAMIAAALLWNGAGRSVQAASKPNLLFIVVDDLGIDQLTSFGNGGILPAATPNINFIALHGVKFTNAWAMPECSPSRATFFTGRYPIRTGVEAAIVENHLPQSYMSSFEATLPRILTKAGYASALMGKYHLGSDQDPAGLCAPSTRGFTVFQGAMTAGPPSVDRTAGGIDKTGSQVCGYYVWPRTSLSGVLDPLFVATQTDNCASTVDRRYLTEAQGDDGVTWWKKQSGPRMLTLSLNSMHTPYQKPPTDLVPDPLDKASTCSNATPPRGLLNMMIEGADVQIGRTLAALGLGTLAANGRTLKSLNLGNTMVVIIGDNGSQGQAVRAPFNPIRAKTSVYQTGVWVPLIIAGPVVKAPGRSVDKMVNSVDLFELFGTLAGVDVKTAVPPSRALDSQPMLPYLTTPATATIRTTNFTQEGVATYSPNPTERSYPCQIGNLCNDTLFGDQAFCEVDNGGVWYGPGAKKQLTSCCAVQKYVGTTLTIAPAHQYAMRGGSFRGVTGAFKLIQMDVTDCSKPITNASQAKPFPWAEYLTTTKQEFYDLTLTKGNPKGLDNAPFNLAKNCAPDQDITTCLPTAIDVANYKLVNKDLQAMLKSATPQATCQAKGDGNMDMRVTLVDIRGWETYKGRGPSRYDINVDGVTDEKDLQIIKANLGLDCMSKCTRADLNRDGKVNALDMALLSKQTGVCADDIFCSGDLDGDGRVDARDVRLMKSAQGTCNR